MRDIAAPNKSEADARLSRLLLTLELQVWKLTQRTRQIFSEEAHFIRQTLGFEA